MSDLFAVAAPAKGNPRSSGYDRADADWYVEEPSAVRALLERERFDGAILDPACGCGNIPLVCREFGYEAEGRDIVDRGFGPVQDFFRSSAPVANIITNPPYAAGAIKFAAHALRIARRKVAILELLSWLEGERRGRSLFDLNKLARVWVFRGRQNMPPGEAAFGPGGERLPQEGGFRAFAWYVFDHAHDAPTWQGGWIV